NEEHIKERVSRYDDWLLPPPLSVWSKFFENIHGIKKLVTLILYASRFNYNRFKGDIFKIALSPGRHVLNRINDIHSLDNLAENRITISFGRIILMVKEEIINGVNEK